MSSPSYLMVAAFSAAMWASPASRPGPNGEPDSDFDNSSRAVGESDPRLVVTLSTPSVKRIVFDPKKPPRLMPRVAGNESALTLFRSDCRVLVTNTLVSQARRHDKVDVAISLDSVRVELALEDTIYLPANVELALRTHEEGHREINQRVYGSSSQPVALAAARAALARSWSGSGRDLESARNAAADAAVEFITGEYRDRVLGRMSRAAQQYDRLTDHGKASTRVSDAVEQALQAVELDQRGP